jgi:hypothetical protein
MSLLNQNKGKDKNSAKTHNNNAANSKFIAKPGKSSSAGMSKKPIKTGGTRGS